MEPGTVLFHVGLPKTGTTSLQETLRRWPNTAGKPFDRDGGRAALQVQRDAKARRLTGAALDDHLAASCARDDLPVVFSAEAFAGAPREWFVPAATPAEVARQLATTTWDPRALVTLRRPRPWLRSCFRYAVRGGLAETYDRFLDRVADDLDTGRGVACWPATVAAYDDAFGTEAVAVAWFEDLVADPAAFWGAVATRLALPGLRALGEGPLPRLNDAHVGPPWLELTLNRHVLRSDLRTGRGPRLLDRPTYYRRIAPRLVRRSSEAWFTDRTTAREPAIVDRLARAAEELSRSHGTSPPAGVDLRGR